MEGPSGSRWTIPPGAESEPPAQSAPLGQEFLFHLYRGSELLKENLVDEAKSELERALSLQPRDIEGQSLLGIVYFRLGHYPRAIHIYEELIRSRPGEIGPKVNLALCYLKTGQLQTARGLLEEVIQLKPDHHRAWGYLGLTFQRLGDTDKACVAFERAGRPQLAERLRQSAIAEQAHTSVEEIGHGDARAALRSELPPSLDRGALRDGAPPRGTIPVAGNPIRLPTHAGRFAREAALVFPENPKVVLHERAGVLARVEAAFFLRPDCLRAWTYEGAPFRRQTVQRQSRHGFLDEPLGGHAHPLIRVEGSGSIVLGAPADREPLVIELDDDPVYVREDVLAGFEPTVTYLNGKLPVSLHEQVPLVQLSGVGCVILIVPRRIVGLAADGSRPVAVRSDRVLGWVGRLFPRIAAAEEGPGDGSSLVSFSGEGTVLVRLDAC